MHVVLLNQAFHPDVAATAQMAKDLADTLVARGHTVTAVASRSIYGKRGSVLPRRETVDGIRVRRVGASLFGKASILLRALDFAIFYARAGWTTLTLPRPSVVIAFSTPPFIAAVAVLARWLRGARAVYWVMDLYPDVPVALGVMKASSPLTRFFEAFHRAVLRRVHANVVLGRCMRDLLLDKRVPQEKIELIPVWADADAITPIPHDRNPYRERWGVGGKFAVVYSGNFGLAHDETTICEALRAIHADTDLRERVRFVFVGGGKRRAAIERFIAEHAPAVAAYHDYVPREDLALSLSAADAHLISVRTGFDGLVVPSKLYGIMAAARPSLYIGSPASEVARVIAETGGGECIAEGDAPALVDAVRRLATDPDAARAAGERARAGLVGAYDRATLCGRWADLLERLCADPEAVPA